MTAVKRGEAKGTWYLFITPGVNAPIGIMGRQYVPSRATAAAMLC